MISAKHLGAFRSTGVLALLAVLTLASSSCRKRATPSTDWPAGMKATTAHDSEDLVRSAKGSVVLYMLYASWCSGCRAELPGIDRLLLKYKAQGLQLVALSLDDDPKDFDELLADQTLHFDLIRVAPVNNGELAIAIHDLGGNFVQAIPYAAVFNRSGKLVRDWPSGSLLGDIEKEIKASL